MEELSFMKLPVGDAIKRLVNLQYIKNATNINSPRIERELEGLLDALNTFEVDVAFDCQPDEAEGGGTSTILDEAETALDVLLCDAETQCCRITEKVASEANRPRRVASSRGG